MPRFADIARLALLAAVLALPNGEANAQRPFSTIDPFYQNESAKRSFYENFSVQAEVAYQGADPVTFSGHAFSPFALMVRLDYALMPQVDVAAVLDASSGVNGGAGGSMRIGWFVVKPYWQQNNTSYAIRVAIDPFPDSGFGFRQTDVAFLSSTTISPTVATDIAIGFRRARVGFEQVTLVTEFQNQLISSLHPEITRSRANGTELHAMWGYRFMMDPGGTHVFTILSAQAMAYSVLTINPDDPLLAGRGGLDLDEPGQLRGGLALVNVGFEYSRPSFVLSPYMSVPLFRMARMDGEGPVYGPRFDHTRLGFRFTVR